MMLKEPVLKILGKQYAPSTMVELKFGRYDLMFKTDDQGRPILLFMGTKIADGNIKGERYSRRLKIDDSGNVIKDHWEHKGKATS
jgi:hypothetical protein